MTTFDCNSLEEFDVYFKELERIYLNEDYTINVYGKNIYLAGPWFDDAALKLCKFVEGILLYESQGIHKVFLPRRGGNSAKHTPRMVFNRNVDEVAKSDIVIAMVSRKDVGTAWEIGMAHALGKEVILLGYDESDFTESKTNLMLAFCGKAMTLPKLVKYLRGNMTEADWFKFNEEDWKVIE